MSNIENLLQLYADSKNVKELIQECLKLKANAIIGLKIDFTGIIRFKENKTCTSGWRIFKI